MHTTVIIPFHHQHHAPTLQWTLEGFARQALSPGHTLEILVGVDGGAVTQAALPAMPDDRFRACLLPRIGSAAVRNTLVKQARVQPDLLIFVNADTRPEAGMVQCHVDTMAKLPQGSVVVGSVPWERSSDATIFDALIDGSPAVFSFGAMQPESWHDFRCTYALNMSVRPGPFQAVGGFPEAIRPMFFEDTALGFRLMGNQAHVFYQPNARVIHRHPLTLEQYLDREEFLGIMAPLYARLCPEAFALSFSSNVPVQALAERYKLWTRMDGPLHRSAYESLRRWTVLPQSRIGSDGPLILSALYELHSPLKRLAFRLGFLKGLELMDDARWQERLPHGLWRQIVGPP